MTAARTGIWGAIFEVVRAEISAGHYHAGDRLPTEAALAARFGVNRHTVRHALAELAAAGLVLARRGVGVFVLAGPAEYPLGRRVRFEQNVLATGRMPSRRFLRLETRTADAAEAAVLRLITGELVQVVEGVSLADAVPLAVFRSVFPAGRFPDLLAALGRQPSITVALAEAGVADYTRASTKLTAVAADALLALHLQVPEGAPVLRSVSLNVDAAGQPIEAGTTWFAGERATLTVTPDP